jgi:outer membrane protein TolC
MTRYRHLLQVSAALLATVPAWAQDASSLTLADALARGRDGARETVAASAHQRSAEAKARQAAGYRLPQVRLSEQWIRTDSPADAFGLLLNQERFSFPSFVTGDPNSPDPLSTAITRLEIEVPIWTGGELSTRVTQARLAADAAADGTARTGDQAAVAAAEAWIRLAQAREAVALFERSRETVAAHVGLARDYAAQGMLVRSDLLRAEVELARVDDLLAEARGNARVAEANLSFRLGEPLGTSHALAPLADPPVLAGDREAWLASTDRRGDLASARKLLAAGELEAKALRGGLFPRIGLVARHDLVDDQLFGSHGDSTTIAAMATFDLFDGGKKRAAIAAAKADADAGRADVERFAEGVRLATRQAWEAAAVALERQATAKSALSAADEGVRIVEERFRAGVVKTTDVLDSATVRREAEMRELVARAEAWLAHLQLALAAGERPESVLSAAHPTS